MTLLWLAGLLAGGANPCEASQLTLRELWQLDCRTARAVVDPGVAKAIKVEVTADGPPVSGKDGVLLVSLRNRSREPVARRPIRRSGPARC